MRAVAAGQPEVKRPPQNPYRPIVEDEDVDQPLLDGPKHGEANSWEKVRR